MIWVFCSRYSIQPRKKIITVNIDPTTGIMPFHTRELAYGLGMSGDTAKQAMKICGKLYNLVYETDASLVEINPLVITGDGDVVALDAGVLPKTSSGKLKRRETRALYETGKLFGRPSARVADPLDTVKEIAKSQLGYVRNALLSRRDD